MVKEKDHEVFTIGYEGKKIDEFLGILQENGIKVLIDVRYLPLSRKKNFSKNPLRKTLSENNIEMISVKEVGAPKEFRDFLKETKDYSRFFEMYLNHIKENGFFEKLRPHINGERVCIMCFEKDQQFCHRSVLSEMLEEEMNARIQHL